MTEAVKTKHFCQVKCDLSSNLPPNGNTPKLLSLAYMVFQAWYGKEMCSLVLSSWRCVKVAWAAANYNITEALRTSFGKHS